MEEEEYLIISDSEEEMLLENGAKTVSNLPQNSLAADRPDLEVNPSDLPQIFLAGDRPDPDVNPSDLPQNFLAGDRPDPDVNPSDMPQNSLAGHRPDPDVNPSDLPQNSLAGDRPDPDVNPSDLPQNSLAGDRPDPDVNPSDLPQNSLAGDRPDPDVNPSDLPQNSLAGDRHDPNLNSDMAENPLTEDSWAVLPIKVEDKSDAEDIPYVQIINSDMVQETIDLETLVDNDVTCIREKRHNFQRKHQSNSDMAQNPLTEDSWAVLPIKVEDKSDAEDIPYVQIINSDMVQETIDLETLVDNDVTCVREKRHNFQRKHQSNSDMAQNPLTEDSWAVLPIKVEDKSDAEDIPYVQIINSDMVQETIDLETLVDNDVTCVREKRHNFQRKHQGCCECLKMDTSDMVENIDTTYNELNEDIIISDSEEEMLLGNGAKTVSNLPQNSLAADRPDPEINLIDLPVENAANWNSNTAQNLLNEDSGAVVPIKVEDMSDTEDVEYVQIINSDMVQETIDLETLVDNDVTFVRETVPNRSHHGWPRNEASARRIRSFRNAVFSAIKDLLYHDCLYTYICSPVSGAARDYLSKTLNKINKRRPFKTDNDEQQECMVCILEYMKHYDFCLDYTIKTRGFWIFRNYIKKKMADKKKCFVKCEPWADDFVAETMSDYDNGSYCNNVKYEHF